MKSGAAAQWNGPPPRSNCGVRFSFVSLPFSFPRMGNSRNSGFSRSGAIFLPLSLSQFFGGKIILHSYMFISFYFWLISLLLYIEFCSLSLELVFKTCSPILMSCSPNKQMAAAFFLLLHSREARYRITVWNWGAPFKQKKMYKLFLFPASSRLSCFFFSLLVESFFSTASLSISLNKTDIKEKKKLSGSLNFRFFLLLIFFVCVKRVFLNGHWEISPLTRGDQLNFE